MIIQITDRCSRGCKHCFLSCVKTDNFMPLDKFKFLIDMIADKTDNIVISGGEPLEHPDVVDMIYYALDNTSKNVTILTSGINIHILEAFNDERLRIQITNDPRYYPVNSMINENIQRFVARSLCSVILSEKLNTMIELGRAKDNSISKYNTKYASCTNPILLLMQTELTSIADWLDMENLMEKFCSSTVDYNLDFYIGECKVFKICNLERDDFSIWMNYYKFNIDKFTCDRCNCRNIDQVREVMIKNNMGW